LASLRKEVARVFVLDSPDRWLALDQVGAWARSLCLVLEAAERWAVINLNVAAAPAWLHEGSVGPLFPERGDRAASSSSVGQLLLQVLAERPAGAQRMLIDWHLRESDLTGADGAWAQAADWARTLPNWRWALDRPGQPIALAEGMERGRHAVLMDVGLNLPLFLQHPGVDGRVDRFLAKLPSLVHMAVSAGVQRRAFIGRRLARDAHLAQGFLLHRAHAVLTPLGVYEVIEQLLGQRAAAGAEGVDLLAKIMRGLRDSAARHGRRRNLELALDLALPTPESDRPASTGYHSAAAGGMMETGSSCPTVEINALATLPAEDLTSLLRRAFKKPDARRLRGPAQKQIASRPPPG
jgi:hypothetical protein